MAVGGRMLAGSLPAAAVTIGALWLLGRGPRDFDAASNLALSIALTASAGAILFRERLGRLVAAASPTPPTNLGECASDGPLRRFLPIAAGIVIGVLVSLSSVGAGALGVTSCSCFFHRAKTRDLVGTDLAHGVVLALATGLGHMLIARVDFALLGQLLLGTLPGIYVGTQMAGLLPETALRRAIAIVLLVVAVKMAFWLPDRRKQTQKYPEEKQARNGLVSNLSCACDSSALMVGGGPVALRKTRQLLEAGCRVSVVCAALRFGIRAADLGREKSHGGSRASSPRW